ncbi:8-amino-7-oxononanoate synthase [Sphingosinicella microcystinivorans]|uniref:8-amino-7-oxononanoate synthase n=1 Tax=Sphingosinicella microcystinivorans TaxID=335406 RepID=A0AAD1D7M7_SPHMI|nr:8-amino-7-oxononanoate synthase [Sphingosinicella microcystinivorans]RKS86519.1 8-amino-7-oxononanoate synthase [Sphingosinicella microcystinivorans]BBE35377.1 8-amino-7-oxononanoate synthase [Sphingosinicella microcystinivorans]
MSVFEPLASDLQRLDAASRRRRLIPRTGTDFSSNDYLALAGDPALAEAVAEAVARGVPAGSGGSRLLRGNHAEHEALEAEAARFFGSESALWFATGYTANSAIISTLPQRGDLVVYDDLIHASVHEGLRLTRAETVAVPHNDVDAFADAIAAWRARGGTGRVWIAVESLYSMDGDRAPLADLAATADANDAVLVIDEAHATGVFGAGGRGLAAALEGRENVITLHTCGKAMGCEGALVCAPAVVTDFLVNRGRGFIFSTAPSPLMAAAVRTALRIIEDADDRRAKLAALIVHAERMLGSHGALISGSQVMPLILGEDARTMRAAGAVQAAGFDVRGIRPPTVPAGTSRLRISLTLNATEDDVSALAAVFQDVLA